MLGRIVAVAVADMVVSMVVLVEGLWEEEEDVGADRSLRVEAPAEAKIEEKSVADKDMQAACNMVPKMEEVQVLVGGVVTLRL